MSIGDTSSRPASIAHSTTSESRLEPAIVLLDKTRANAAERDDARGVAVPVEGPSAEEPSLIDRQLSRRWTKSSLQHARTQRKYKRYQEDQIVEQEGDGDGVEYAAKGRREKGKTMVKDFWRGKKIRQTQEDDTILEVLYENQRGFFTFGTPHFSSKSLLNFDPKAWTNARMRSSPVNITNAQVPDPNWEWAWKTWYVDMSRDVDEDGWEYSLAFVGFSWHGNHPWFHSFVRRRRWLRQRVRKHAHHASGRTPGQKHLAEAHMLTPEYFTIHPSNSRSVEEGRAGSLAASGSPMQQSVEDFDDEEAAHVKDIASLLRLLKRATIDREKIVLIRNFLHNADDELYYLEEEMPHIMSMLVFQNSRQALLKMLMDDLNSAKDHREKHKADDQAEGEKEARHIDNLLKAAHAADRQVKQLEFWSDIRVMVRDGKTNKAVDDSSWQNEKWQGVDASGPLATDQSDAKEPGRTNREIQQEMQILERASTRGSVNEADAVAASKKANKVAEKQSEGEGRDEEATPIVFSSGEEYATADEVPISLDKGKGKERA